MCGLLGVVDRGNNYSQTRVALHLINHRGPDSTGEWSDPENGVWLGHNRLSIMDLSSAGHQPMQSDCSNYVIIFNGEIYNFSHLRAELVSKGYQFKSATDTEVVLAGCIVWGIANTLKKLEGMFAFAFYDRSDNSIYLARDGMGIKPLYYAHLDSKFAFCSELTPLNMLPWVDSSINEDARFSYFRYGCVPCPVSIFNGVKKLKAGHYLKFKNSEIFEKKFWDLTEIAHRKDSTANNFTDLREASLFLENILLEAVSNHMQSDVPYGAFLSGGIDSTTVVALMQRISSKPVKTFSVGFLNSVNDESVHAKSIAKHLGTDHSELKLEASDVVSAIPNVIRHFDEPFADNSAVPTYLISKFAREKVKVCLSGDGGDELFGGYPRYFWASRIEFLKNMLTSTGARFLGRNLSLVPAKFWDGIINPLTGRKYSGVEGLSGRVDRFASYLMVSRDHAYRDTMAYWSNPSEILDYSHKNTLGPDGASHRNLDWAEEMMLIDQQNYLQDDILTKVDRATMAVSLEARVPLLDRKIVNYSWNIANKYKFDPKGDRGKIVLREVLNRYVPATLIDRPKQGFGMPLNDWLRGPLRDWAESLLDAKDLEDSGLNSGVVRSVWQRHLDGVDLQKQIWSILVYREWLIRASTV